MKQELITKLFEFIAEGWEVYLSLDETDKIVLLRSVCSKCRARWLVDEKECFYCKAWYPHIIKCQQCGRIIAEENLRKCPQCGKKNTTNCLNCGKGGEEDQFVPISFCQKCGNRENRFEYKIYIFRK
jgi:RNA polymerase subunit RPABC4/transcription elongation factor Spt4